MIKLYIPFLLFITCFFKHPAFSQEGWYQLNSGTSNNLRSVFFTDANTGYAAGSGGTILKTTDGGLNWSAQQIGVTDSLYSVYFIDEIGFIAGGTNSPVLLKTTNGGANWISQVVPTSYHGLGSVFMIDSTTIFASGRGILKTTNSGANWNIQLMDSILGVPAYFSSIFFANENTGFAGGNNLMHYGGVFVKTTNGGINWSGILGGIKSIYFINQSTGYGAFGCDGSRIFKTTNGGENWINQFLPGQNFCITSIWVIDDITGYAVGAIANSNIGLIFKTNNSGTNWNLQSVPAPALSSVFFIDALTGYAVGNSGTILKTTNGGVSSISTLSNEIPHEYKLHQNFPNPFNPSTTIRFDIAKTSSVKLTIYDLTGREISIPVDRDLTPGSYEYSFTAEGLPSGVYLYRLKTDNYTESRRMLLIK